jgi:predicted phage tail protein
LSTSSKRRQARRRRGSYPIRLWSGSTATEFSAANVPPGMYRVRVRGVSAAGEGEPTAAIAVSVR